MTHGVRLGYRPALDGLRAIAVLLVIATHAAVPHLTEAGAVGVTMFFVLSGFLITRLLLDEREHTGRIRLRRFYARRARRLLPALVALLLVDGLVRIILGLSLIPVVLAATYTSNIGVALFAVPLGELNHIWSLSLEEQFYLLWPAVLLLLIRTRFVFPVLAVGVFVSAGLRVGLWIGGASLTRVVFGPDTRADALLVGCLLGLMIYRIRRPGRVVVAVSTVVLGGACLSGEVAGLWMLMPAAVGAAGLIAWSLDHHGWLTWHPLVFTGRISYGLYLWHHPVALMVLARFGPAGLPITLAVSFALASASWFVIERPFMRRPVSVAADTPAEVVAPTAEVSAV